MRVKKQTKSKENSNLKQGQHQMIKLMNKFQEYRRMTSKKISQGKKEGTQTEPKEYV